MINIFKNKKIKPINEIVEEDLIEDEIVVDDNLIVDEIIEEPVEEIKTFETIIFEVEDNSIIVGINGCRMRFYYDLPDNILTIIRNNRYDYVGRRIKLQYIGDLNNTSTLKRLPIKEWF